MIAPAKLWKCDRCGREEIQTGSRAQARTADQLCSFATLCGEKAPLLRTKGTDGKTDVFTCMSDQGHTTMNVVGKITYEGTWPEVQPGKG